MKQTPLILSIIALVASVVFGVLSLTSNGGGKKVSPAAKGDSTAVAGSIVYFNSVLSNADFPLDRGDVGKQMRKLLKKFEK